MDICLSEVYKICNRIIIYPKLNICNRKMLFYDNIRNSVLFTLQIAVFGGRRTCMLSENLGKVECVSVTYR